MHLTKYVTKDLLRGAGDLFLTLAPHVSALPGAALAAKGAYDAGLAFREARRALKAAAEHDIPRLKAELRAARTDLLWATAELALAVTPTGRHLPRAVTIGRSAVQTAVFVASAHRAWSRGAS
jgi:hypothetical protein